MHRAQDKLEERRRKPMWKKALLRSDAGTKGGGRKKSTMESCDDSEGLKVEPINRHCSISKVDRQSVSIVHDSDGTFGKCSESGIIKRHCAESHHV